MNTNHQILNSPILTTVPTNVRRQALWQTSLILAFAATLLSAVLGITSCQSPVEIDTPRSTKADITWTTVVNNNQVQDHVATLNNAEPEATFSLMQSNVAYSSNVPTTATFSRLAYVEARFKNTDPTRSVSITADGANYRNYQLSNFASGAAFVLTPYIVVSDVSTSTPLQFNTQGYTLSDNKIDWLGNVEITSHKNGVNRYSLNIQRGQPLNLRWTSDVSGADGAEVSVIGYGTNSQTPNGGLSSSDPITVSKSIATSGVNEAAFTADEMNKFPNGTPITLRVRYFKAKSVNNGKAVLISSSVGFVDAFMP